MGKKVLVDLTHPFSAEIPRWPYFVKPVIDSMHTMAKGGVLTQRVDCVQHTGTHADAPRHVMEREFDGKRARYTHEMPVDAYTGDAVCLEIKIHPWGLIVRPSISRTPASAPTSSRKSSRAWSCA